MLFAASCTAVVVATIVLLVKKLCQWRKYYGQLSKLPGPAPSFLLGNLSMFYESGKPLTHSEFIAFVTDHNYGARVPLLPDRPFHCRLSLESLFFSLFSLLYSHRSTADEHVTQVPKRRLVPVLHWLEADRLRFQSVRLSGQNSCLQEKGERVLATTGIFFVNKSDDPELSGVRGKVSRV